MIVVAVLAALGVGRLRSAVGWFPNVAGAGWERTGIGHWWRCSSGEPGMPAWSPDGAEIAYGKPTDCGTKIAVYDLRTGRTRLVTGGTSDGRPDWSPDGRSLAYQNGSDERLVDLATGASTVVIHRIEEFGARFSPRGRFIAYTHGFMGSPFDGGDSTTSVYVEDQRTGAKWRVAGHDVNGGTATWSPDGSHLAVEGFSGLYVVERSGRNLRRVAPLSVDTPGAPAWSRSGQIAFIEYGSVELLDLSGGRVRTLVRCACDPASDGVSWSPTSGQLAYSTDRGIFVTDASGARPRELIRY